MAKIIIMLLSVYSLVACQPNSAHQNSSPIRQKEETDGTSTQGGGGGGLACFTNEFERKESILSDGRVPPKSRHKIKKLQVLDYFYVIKKDDLLQPLPQENAKAFLLRIIETKIRPLNDIFATKINQALDLIQIGNWDEKTDMGLVYDWGEKNDEYLKYLKDKFPECTPIQMAVRHVKISSPSEAAPVVKVDLDSKYFNQLIELNGQAKGVLNQSALYLHEILYLLGDFLNQKDSEFVRNLVGRLLSNSTYESDLPLKKKRFVFRAHLGNSGFDHFAKVVLIENRISSQKQLQIQNYESLSIKRRELIEKWPEKTSDDDYFDYLTLLNIQDNSKLGAYIRKQIGGIVSPAEAFMLTAIEAFKIGEIENYDIFLMPGADDSSQFSKVCSLAATPQEELKSIYEKTMEFCSNSK